MILFAFDSLRLPDATRANLSMPSSTADSKSRPSGTGRSPSPYNLGNASSQGIKHKIWLPSESPQGFKSTAVEPRALPPLLNANRWSGSVSKNSTRIELIGIRSEIHMRWHFGSVYTSSSTGSVAALPTHFALQPSSLRFRVAHPDKKQRRLSSITGWCVCFWQRAIDIHQNGDLDYTRIRDFNTPKQAETRFASPMNKVRGCFPRICIQRRRHFRSPEIEDGDICSARSFRRQVCFEHPMSTRIEWRQDANQTDDLQ